MHYIISLFNFKPVKNHFLLLIPFFLLIACDEDSPTIDNSPLEEVIPNDTVVEVEIKMLQFDVTLSSGEISVGLIDDSSKQILLYNVVDPIEIVSVAYKCSEGVSISPKPEDKIGNWKVSEAFVLNGASGFKIYSVNLPDYAKPTFLNQATIAPLDTFGCTIKYHMLDLNANASKAADENTANIAFGQKKLNGIRFPIYCGDSIYGDVGAHATPGVVVESVYANALKSLENAKKYYKGAEPFIIFAGVKVMTSDKNEYFPDWVTTDSEFIPNPDKYAQLIVDFISFMHDKGHEVNAIALTKEAAKMEVENFKETVDSIRARTARLGYVVPKSVAPELFKADGDNADGFMNQLYEKGCQDSYEIYGNHYYHWQYNVSGYANLAYEYNLAQSDKKRPFWATEPHWDKSKDLTGVETAICPMFLQTDLGLEAFMWWGAHYPITGSSNMQGPIIRAYSDAILRSTPIRMIDHDGEEVITRGKLQSRAYLRGNEVNVFLINSTSSNPVSYEDYAIGILDDFNVKGTIAFRQWREDTDNEGEVMFVDPVNDNQFLIDLPTGSFTQLTFIVAK